MTITVKPSDIYRNIHPSVIQNFLVNNYLRIVTFKLIETGDLVLFYNNGDLNVGTATVRFAGYPRFVVETTHNSCLNDFWE